MPSKTGAGAPARMPCITPRRSGAFSCGSIQRITSIISAGGTVASRASWMPISSASL
ncbi:MAG: hypothetical protein U1E02_33285 [Hydrogenophaga sp.]|nr:hypothetical protein [Hydrogenophaga sp.]